MLGNQGREDKSWAACARLPTDAPSQYVFRVRSEVLCVRAQPRSGVPKVSFILKDSKVPHPHQDIWGFSK